MSTSVVLRVDLPDTRDRLRLPAAVDERLTMLLDRQDRDGTLTAAERREAEGLVDLADLLSLLRLRAEQVGTDVTAG
jgi:hypothetical protein